MSERENARDWYRRTTRNAIRSIAGATVVAAVAAVLGFVLVPHEYTLSLQVFNGAWTIPAFGGIWLAAFIFIWLIPMRELGFRSQECMERMEERLITFLDDAKLFLTDARRVLDKIEAKTAEVDRMMATLDRIADSVEPDPILTAGELAELAARNGGKR